MPRWPDESEDDGRFAPTRGGLLDGLPSPNTGSSLHLLLDPKVIATIDGLPATVREGATWGNPVPALPAGPEPEEYAKRGEMAGQILLNPADPDGNSELSGPLYLAQDLLKFRRGGSLDAQAYGALPPYGNYTFGVYNAAAGLSLLDTLGMANTYGKWRSHYGKDVPMDNVYSSIPASNVENIVRGYSDYKNRALARRP
jgi:hypothetical protein